MKDLQYSVDSKRVVAFNYFKARLIPELSLVGRKSNSQCVMKRTVKSVSRFGASANFPTGTAWMDGGISGTGVDKFQWNVWTEDGWMQTARQVTEDIIQATVSLLSKDMSQPQLIDH